MSCEVQKYGTKITGLYWAVWASSFAFGYFFMRVKCLQRYKASNLCQKVLLNSLILIPCNTTLPPARCLLSAIVIQRCGRSEQSRPFLCCWLQEPMQKSSFTSTNWGRQNQWINCRAEGLQVWCQKVIVCQNWIAVLVKVILLWYKVLNGYNLGQLERKI